VDYSGALGETRVAANEVDAVVEITDAYQASCYRDLLEALMRTGAAPAPLLRAVEAKLAAFARRSIAVHPLSVVPDRPVPRRAASPVGGNAMLAG
jgi:hypothetical protein